MSIEKQPSLPQETQEAIISELEREPEFEALDAEFSAELIDDGEENWSPLDDTSFAEYAEARTFKQLNPNQKKCLEVEANGFLDDFTKSEAELDRMTKDPVAAYFIKVSRNKKLLSRSEEVELAKRIEKKDKHAKDEFIERNLRLVIAIAKFYFCEEMEFLDLIQEGNLGLIKATEQFDYRMGNKFSTFATWHIKKAIRRSIQNKARSIRIPVHVLDKDSKISKIEQKSPQGIKIPIENLCLQAEVTKNEAEEIFRARTLQPISLNSSIPGTEDKCLEDEIESMDDPEDQVIANINKEAIRKVLEKLPERERKALEIRFGLKTGVEQTQKFVGQQLGISQMHAHRIIKKTLENLSTNVDIKNL